MTLSFAGVFPGQGAQQVGMLKDMAERFSLVGHTFERASAVLGYDLWKLVQEGPQDQLNLTEQAQPALLTSSVALWLAWREQAQALPQFLAGHSLGEWSALVAAGVVAFEDAVDIVRLRGRYMQEAVPAGVGAMAAILGLDDDQVESACRGVASGLVAPVNYNSPGQLVIAGHKQAVDEAIEACKALGAKRALPLPVSAPFHTALMRPAAERLAEKLEETVFASPQLPVIHNVHGQTEADPGRIKSLMIEQIYSPVRWVACVEQLASLGALVSVEFGPGKVLSGLNKRINKQWVAYATEDAASWDAALAAVK